MGSNPTAQEKTARRSHHRQQYLVTETSKTYLGAQFRRLRTKLGAPIAIKAMAAKLARLVYRILRYGVKYVDQGAALYEAQHKQLQIKQLKWKAAKLGFQIVQTSAA